MCVCVCVLKSHYTQLHIFLTNMIFISVYLFLKKAYKRNKNQFP